jgi:hypothetical protein
MKAWHLKSKTSGISRAKCRDRGGSNAFDAEELAPELGIRQGVRALATE